MSRTRLHLREAHRTDLAERIESLGSRVEQVGADPECARRAHALMGAALTVGLDLLAVAAAALEAACDDDGGDPVAAARAIGVARRAIADDAARDPCLRHELRGSLGIVVGHAGLLELEPLTPTQKGSLAEILAAADSMTAVLQSLDGDEVGCAGPRATVASQGCHVLLVEDDAVTASLVGRLVTELGASVTIAPGASEALRAVAARRPDLVLLDLCLGDADGRAVLREIRATAGLGDVPVVVSSGTVSASLRQRLAAEGASAVLPKPVTLDALRALIADRDG